jgi:hypothetical protein
MSQVEQAVSIAPHDVFAYLTGRSDKRYKVIRDARPRGDGAVALSFEGEDTFSRYLLSNGSLCGFCTPDLESGSTARQRSDLDRFEVSNCEHLARRIRHTYSDDSDSKCS